MKKRLEGHVKLLSYWTLANRTHLDNIESRVVEHLILPELYMVSLVLPESIQVVSGQRLEHNGPQLEAHIARKGVDHGGECQARGRQTRDVLRSWWLTVADRG